MLLKFVPNLVLDLDLAIDLGLDLEIDLLGIFAKSVHSSMALNSKTVGN